jgi:predicted Zn-dependent protease with MMP-like domain
MREHTPPGADTDPFSAHLDRAWELLDRGDVTGAATAADSAARHAPSAPELLTLQGAIAAACGDTDAALEHYAAAMEADPDYASPLLQTAELYLYSLDDPERALELVRRARDLVNEDDELADAVLLTAEAELALDHREAAANELDELNGVSIDEPTLHCRAGQLSLDLDLLDGAARHFRAAIGLDRELPDAHHGLGLVCEARGDGAGMRKAWLQTRKYDLQSPRAPWHVSESEFENIAEAAFASLPDEVKQHLHNVPILICDYPSIEIVAEGNDPRMLGFFTGIPLGEKSNVGGGQVQPDCVFLYQRNIENACRSGDDLEHEIHVTLWHETAHFFGLEDDDLDGLGLG